MVSEELKNYVVNSLEDGLSPTAIKNAITKAGWSKEQVEEVFTDMEVKRMMGVEDEEEVEEGEVKPNIEEELPAFEGSSSKEEVKEGEIDPEMRSYVIENIKAGFSNLAIRMNLVDAGWDREDIDKVFFEREVLDLLSKKETPKNLEEEPLVEERSEEEVQPEPDRVEEETAEEKEIERDEEKLEEEEVLSKEDKTDTSSVKETEEAKEPSVDEKTEVSPEEVKDPAEGVALEEKDNVEEFTKAETPPVKETSADEKTEASPEEIKDPAEGVVLEGTPSSGPVDEPDVLEKEKGTEKEVEAEVPPVKDPGLKEDNVEIKEDREEQIQPEKMPDTENDLDETEPASPGRKVRRSVSNPASFFIEDSMSASGVEGEVDKDEGLDEK